MSERENNVYKAKLAEQAERYDGELNGLRNGETLKKDLQTPAQKKPPPSQIPGLSGTTLVLNSAIRLRRRCFVPFSGQGSSYSRENPRMTPLFTWLSCHWAGTTPNCDQTTGCPNGQARELSAFSGCRKKLQAISRKSNLVGGVVSDGVSIPVEKAAKWPWNVLV